MEEDSPSEEVRRAYSSGNPRLALELAAPLLEHDPTNVGLLIFKAQALQDLGQFLEASDVYHQLLEHVRPKKRPLVYRQLGLLAQEQGELGEAEEWYKRAMATDPQNPRAFIYLGALLAERGELAEAELHHRGATACSGGLVEEAWLNLGFVLREQGRSIEALGCFERALEIDPEYVEALEARNSLGGSLDGLSEP